MKKLLSLAVIVSMLCFTGCGETDNGSAVSTAEGNSSEISNSVKITSKDDLSGKKVGTQLGTTGYTLANDIDGAIVTPFNKGSDAIDALNSGNVDAVIIDSEPAKVFVSQDDGLEILSEPFVEEEYCIAFNKENTELGQKLDDAITKLKENGVLDEINSHWIGDSADQTPYTPNAELKRENGNIIMATNAEFPPYESLDGQNVVGIDVDIMNAVCDELDMGLEIKNMDFDSIIPAVNSGSADVGVAGISINPQREKNVSFTQSYATSTQVIIVKK